MSISKREQIIIAVTLLAALYAGWQLLFSRNAGNQSPSAVKDKPADEFLMEVAQGLALNRPTEIEKAVLEKTERPWPADPFVQTVPSSQTTGTDTSSQSTGTLPDSFSYTGYIEAGHHRLAIIGGTEYEIGDMVADSLLTVRGISPGQVLLEDPEGRRYSAPLQDGSDGTGAPISLQFE
jgi:hypothetical protein